MPLFYNRLQALDAQRHGALKIRPAGNFAFARETNSIPLAADELFVAQAHYPIVFTAGERPIPVAVVGLHNGHNLFVSENGAWRAGAYVPAYVRRYPFAVAKAEGDGSAVLAIDEGAALLSPEEGAPLFEEGQPSAITRRAFEFCNTLQTPFETAQRFGQALAEANLLVEREAQIRSGAAESTPFVFGGFRIVDEARFNTLADDTYLDWRRRGWVALVHAHLMSLQHWPRLAALAGATAAVPIPQDPDPATLPPAAG